MKIKSKKTTASNLEKKFDAGEDVMDYFDTSRAYRPGLEAKRVNVDFPVWMVHSLDREAERRGVTRQSLIKMWVNDRLEQKKT